MRAKRPRSGTWSGSHTYKIDTGSPCTGHLLRSELRTNMNRRIMPSAKNEFTSVSKLRAEAFGEPGKRTFRIQVDSSSSTASIWIEKEQLFQLALAIQQMMATLTEERTPTGSPPTDREAPGLTSLDFKVMKLVLGHDAGRGLFIIDAHDAEDEERATIRVWADKQQISGFSEQALRACAAGRPLCPLCGRAIDPDGHRCARVNGHAKLTPEDLADPE